MLFKFDELYWVMYKEMTVYSLDWVMGCYSFKI